MSEWLSAASPVTQALLAGVFTWAVTALGAASVFLFRNFDRRALDAMLGFAAGVMLAASFWSLLAPAIQMSARLGVPAWFPAAVGVLVGAATIRLADLVLPHLHPLFPRDAAEGLPTRWQRPTLLVLAITLHNIPEGLAIGVAFGAAASDVPNGTLAGAIALTIGIALQNFPEGVAVAAPLRREGLPPLKCFWYGQLSALVEPVAAVIGAAAVVYSTGFLPYALSFAAGAMIFVVIEEVIPEAERGGHTDLATMSAMVGFVAMMALDVGLG